MIYAFITNLCLAVAMIENPDNVPYNPKHGSYGPLQIREMCLTDVNRYAGTSYRLEDFIDNMPLSVWAFEQYGLRYRCKTPAGFVRNWHRGRTKAELEDYVERVMTLYKEFIHDAKKQTD